MLEVYNVFIEAGNGMIDTIELIADDFLLTSDSLYFLNSTKKVAIFNWENIRGFSRSDALFYANDEEKEIRNEHKHDKNRN